MRRRTESFRLVMTKNERQLLTDVAGHLRRSESDTVRWLVTDAADRLGITPATSAAERRRGEPVADQFTNG